MELFSLLAKLTLDAKDFNKELDDAQKAADNFKSPDEQKLELDTSDYDKGIGDSESLSTGFTTNVGSAFDELKGLIVGSGVAAAVLGVVNGLKEAVNLTAETADGIEKGAARLGISTDKYQAWDHALRQSGASIQDLQKGVLLFNKAMEGEATDDVAAAFESLKLDPKDFKDSEQLIEATLMKLAELPNDAERMNLVTALFGRGGTSLNALLDEGTEGVKQLLSEAGDLGLIMSEEEISNAVKYGDAVENLNDELNAIKMAFVQDIIPVLKDATEWLTSLLQTFNPRLRENSITETFQKIDEESTKSLQTIKENKSEAEALVKKLAEMGDYWQLDEDEKKKYNSLVEELKKLYPELDKVIGDNTYSINTNKDAILKNIDAWTRLEQQRILDQNIAEKKEAVAAQYAAALDKEVEAELKSADAERYHADAVDELNKALAKEGMEQLGKDSTYDEFLIARSKLANKYAGRPNGELKFEEYRTIGSQYTKVKEEESKLREEAKGLYADADKAQEKLTKYSSALSRKLGITLTDTTKVKNEIQALKQELNSMPPSIRVSVDTPRAMTHAIGADYIPYDNYPALLHRGERVLTATEARQDNRGVDLSGLEDRIIQAIQEGMKNAEVNSYLDGQAITDKVSKNLANQMADRRYV